MYILRHAPSTRTESTEKHLDSGDPDLSERGISQAESLREFVADLGITAVVTARNRRCFRTGALATYGLGIPLYVNRNLNELDWGSDAGRLQSEVFTGPVDNSGDYRGLDLRPNNRAETCIEVAKRVLTVMAEWHGTDETPLLVTSGQVVKATVAVTEGWNRSEMLKYPVPHGQILWFEPWNGVPQLAGHPAENAVSLDASPMPQPIAA